MTNWTPPNVVTILADAEDIHKRWIEASGVSSVTSAEDGDWVLKAHNGSLAIVRPDGVHQKVDFTKGKSQHRAKEAAGGAPHLKKSLGLLTFFKKYGRLPTVVDATGGWGQDAWVIASLGCCVMVIEKNPIVHAVLACGLELAARNLRCAEIAERITLINHDACSLLSDLQADIIYLDPMYPHRERKKADSKKGMQILQSLLGPSDESLSLKMLEAATSAHASRVVVKRPKSAPALELAETFKGQRFDIESPNTRYDVYQKVVPV